MRYLSLFSGAGGGDLAMQHLLGFRCVGYVEYENYCQEVLKQRIADGLLDAAPIFGDIRQFNSEGYAESYQGMVDLVTGGFPCQDISCANTVSAKGILGERSWLWKTMAETIRIIGPGITFLENSPMLTLRGLGTVLRDLAEIGFDARWCVLGANELGCQHRRQRIWIIANAHQRALQPLEQCNLKDYVKRNSEEWDKNRVHFVVAHDGTTYPSWGTRGQTVASRPIMWRSSDDLANGLDRITAIGNGQVPIVAATAFRILAGQ